VGVDVSVWAEPYEVASAIDAPRRLGPWRKDNVHLFLWWMPGLVLLPVFLGVTIHPKLWLALLADVLWLGLLLRFVVPHKGMRFWAYVQLWLRDRTTPRLFEGGAVKEVHARITAVAHRQVDQEERGLIEAADGDPVRAVIEVIGTTNLRLTNAETLGDRLHRYAQWLNQLKFPVQVVIRARPVDIEPQVARLRQSPDPGDRELADYLVSWVQGKALLDRRWFAAVGGGSEVILEDRLKSVMDGLSRAGLSGRRLNGDLLSVLRDCWTPFRHARAEPQPSTIVRLSDRVIVDGVHSRTLFLDRLPAMVDPNWLKSIIDSNVAADVVFWIEPLPTSEQVKELDSQIGGWQTAQYIHFRNKGFSDQDLQDQIDQGASTRQLLSRRRLSIFRVSIAFVLRAKTAEDLAKLEREVTDLLSEQLGIDPVLPADLRHDEGYRLAVPVGEADVTRPIRVTTPALARTYPFSDSSLVMPGGVPLGRGYESFRPMLLDPYAFANSHLLVLATSGVGKSFLLKIFFDRWIRMYDDIDVYIVDQWREYHALAWDIWQRQDAFQRRIPPEWGLDWAKRTSLLYELFGPAPSPIVQLVSLEDAMWERWERDEGHGPHRRRCTVFDLSGSYQDAQGRTVEGMAEADRSLAIERICRELEAKAERQKRLGLRRKTVILLDELWSLLDPDLPSECGMTLERVWRTGRKHGIMAVGVSQMPTDVLHNKRGAKLASLALTHIYMRQRDNELANIAGPLRLSAAEHTYLAGVDKGEGLIVADTKRVAFTLREQISQREYAFAHTD
jgi:hypothetical protein